MSMGPCGTDRGTFGLIQKTEENANHRTNVRLLDMLEEGKDYTAVGHHYAKKESLIRYIKKEESTKI